jgi:uncharacterized membrane protein
MMLMHPVTKYILLFFIYSLIGVIVEIVFGLIVDQRINGVIYGFLLLPIMPIYGFGAAFVLFMRRYLRNPVTLFIGSVLVMTFFEFISHWLFQMLLGIQFWDYSNKPFNIEGRVSLDSSIGFGVAAVLLVYVIHPWILRLLSKISKRLSIVLAILASIILLVETVSSVVKRLL